ncbi:hypothetical protein AAVH_03264 [Aphelenchoides avenae]|nr:hypothetical protein AAVH_03264 [Aphelenchus avenae]
MSRDDAPRKLTDLPPEELARKLQEMTQRALEAEAQLAAESRKSKRKDQRTKEEPVPTNVAPGTTRKKERTVDRESTSESSRPAVCRKKAPPGTIADASGKLKLLEGYTIPTGKGYAYRVNKQLTQRVYLVTRQDTSLELCMKIEPTQAVPQISARPNMSSSSTDADQPTHHAQVEARRSRSECPAPIPGQVHEQLRQCAERLSDKLEEELARAQIASSIIEKLRQEDHSEYNRRVEDLQLQLECKDIELQNELTRVDLFATTIKDLREGSSEKRTIRSAFSARRNWMLDWPGRPPFVL